MSSIGTEYDLAQDSAFSPDDQNFRVFAQEMIALIQDEHEYVAISCYGVVQEGPRFHENQETFYVDAMIVGVIVRLTCSLDDVASYVDKTMIRTGTKLQMGCTAVWMKSQNFWIGKGIYCSEATPEQLELLEIEPNRQDSPQFKAKL